MDENDLCFCPATTLAREVAARRISPVEIVDAVIARIERLEPTLNAFATFTPEAARDDARRAEAAVMRGDALGPLHGVPVTIKDLADVGGLPTERGSHVHRGEVAASDTVFVARLAAAGAIRLGKTTTSEFGWKGVSQSPLTGITSNPWRAGHNAGASSAGAGAAAAAGYGPLHHGSDGAGSIRMPAHFCGVFGHKPTFGRIPNVPVRNNDQASHHGPMTRTVADAALMLRVMAGPHPLDQYSLEAPPVDYAARLAEPLAHPRVAFSPDLGHARVDPDVARIVEAAAGALADALAEDGGELVPTDTPFAADGPAIARFFWAAHEQPLACHVPEFGDRMDPGLLACIDAGAGATALDYLEMRERKHAYVAAMQVFFQEWDFLVTPAVSVAAFPAERLQPEHWPQHAWDWLSWAEFSYPFNLSGNPAAIVPAGFTPDGLPVGLQIVGRRFDDLGVLKAAARFEAARPWASHRPPLPDHDDALRRRR